MVQINGTYKHYKNENFKEYLTGYKVSAEHAEKAASFSPTLEVALDGDKLTLTTTSPLGSTVTQLIVNKEVEEALPLGFKVQSTAKVDGNKIIVVSKHPDVGGKGTRTYVFSDTELVLTLEGEGIPTAKRFYKRA